MSLRDALIADPAAFEPMSALDASFLYAESERTPLHIGSLTVFEGARFFDETGQFRLDDVRAHVASRLHLIPNFRRRMATPPYRTGPTRVGGRHRLRHRGSRPPDGPARARDPDRAGRPVQPVVRPSARPHPTAVGALLRGRARRRQRGHDRAGAPCAGRRHLGGRGGRRPARRGAGTGAHRRAGLEAQAGARLVGPGHRRGAPAGGQPDRLAAHHARADVVARRRWSGAAGGCWRASAPWPILARSCDRR